MGWHWRHDWTRWQTVDVVVYTRRGDLESQRQIRECKVCGKKEMDTL